MSNRKNPNTGSVRQEELRSSWCVSNLTLTFRYMGRAWIASVGEHKLRARRGDVISVTGDGDRLGFGGSVSVALKVPCFVNFVLFVCLVVVAAAAAAAAAAVVVALILS